MRYVKGEKLAGDILPITTEKEHKKKRIFITFNYRSCKSPFQIRFICQFFLSLITVSVSLLVL